MRGPLSAAFMVLCAVAACEVSVAEEPAFQTGLPGADSDDGYGTETGDDDDDDDDDTGTSGGNSGGGGNPGGTGGPDTSGGPGDDDCGNGMLDPGESCDGQDFDGETCEGFGFDGGTLTCDGCSIDTSACFGCGNGQLEMGEQCDGTDFGGETCASQGDFYDGTLACAEDCTIDTSACLVAECGDGIKNQDSEDCDADDLDGKVCADVGDYWMGTLACADDCTFDVAECELAECGDGVKNQDSEDCDTDDLDGKTCTDIGYDWGDVTCQQDCTFDDSQCLICAANLDPCQSDDDCCPGLSCSGWPLFWCN